MAEPATEKKLSRRVSEASPKDVGRGLVRLDPQDLESIGASIGGVVEVAGQRPTVARAMPAYAEHRGRGAVQMDGIVRANAGAGLDEQVTVRPVEVQPAVSVLLAPLEGAHAFSGTEVRYLARLLDGIPVVVGDRVRVEPARHPDTDLLRAEDPAGRAGADRPGHDRAQRGAGQGRSASRDHLRGHRRAASRDPPHPRDDRVARSSTPRFSSGWAWSPPGASF